MCETCIVDVGSWTSTSGRRELQEHGQDALTNNSTSNSDSTTTGANTPHVAGASLGAGRSRVAVSFRLFYPSAAAAAAARQGELAALVTTNGAADAAELNSLRLQLVAAFGAAHAQGGGSGSAYTVSDLTVSVQSSTTNILSGIGNANGTETESDGGADAVGRESEGADIILSPVGDGGDSAGAAAGGNANAGTGANCTSYTCRVWAVLQTPSGRTGVHAFFFVCVVVLCCAA